MSNIKLALIFSGITNISKVAGICYLVSIDYPWWSLLLLAIGFNYKEKNDSKQQPQQGDDK